MKRRKSLNHGGLYGVRWQSEAATPLLIHRANLGSLTHSSFTRCSQSGVAASLCHRTPCKKDAGAVLLEVVLALVLIASAAAVIGAGLSASIDRVERLKLNAHAADLAVSVMSELQIGSKVLSEEEGPEPFEAPFENWTWEAQAEMTDETVRDTGRTRKIEVIIRHEDPPVVYRLAQVIRVPEKAEDVLLEFGF